MKGKIIFFLAVSGALIMDGIHWIKTRIAKGRLKMMTWTCHICGEERPDEYISVMSKSLNIPNVDAEQNIRYCNDKPKCAEGAETFSFVQGSEGDE